MIGTTREEIRQWLTFYPEKPEDATHMIVVHDEFDHDCYPAYIRPGEDVRDKIIEVDKESLHEAMEVYAFHLDIEQQLRERRAWHPESAPPPVVPDPSIMVAKAPGRKPPERPQGERPGCATQKAAMALPAPSGGAQAAPRSVSTDELNDALSSPVQVVRTIQLSVEVGMVQNLTLDLLSDGSVRWRD
jgi:hypothetical protein